ncbi:MAG: type III-A CRISPR-associated protein Cas10/Csm1 [Haliscomenobacteraceae bacterium CHB4]|nr:type III-A CRISPR-associated protein Cas10/Csm1 [Haliscomenobacteraceae bacterium CHB4]
MNIKFSHTYLSTLTQILDLHPITKQAMPEYAHWTKLAGDGGSPPAELPEGFDAEKATAPQQSIFSFLGENKGGWYLPQAHESGFAFPQKEKPIGDATKWIGSFKKSLTDAPKHDDPAKAAEQLFFIMEEHCTSIASGWYDGISLFDFSRATTAEIICRSEAGKTGAPFLLVSGGLSGIQDYLYDIVSRKASKNLKGRSFFLQLLSDTVVMELLHVLGLFRANVLSSSGSKFVLLAPNTAETTQKLAAFSGDLSERLFSEFKTHIFLEMGWHEMPEFSPGFFSETFGEIARQVSAKKQHKFSDIIRAKKIKTDERKTEVNGYEYFFEPMEIDGEEERDAITNEEIFAHTKTANLKAEDGEEIVLKELTRHQMELSGLLHHNDFLVSGTQEIVSKNWEKIQIAGSPIFQILTGGVSEKAPQNFVLHIGSTKIDWQQKNSEAVCGFQLFAGNKVPTTLDEKKYERPKTFEELANDGQSRFKRLGFLRMDVDGLGSTFRLLFNKENNPHFPKSVAGYCAMSRSLDYFMKGFLNEMWGNDDKFKEYVQITYAGGDDLFIVGKWDEIVRMAKQIREKFREWVCQNEILGISGGIELVTSKFPTIRAVDEAAGAEDAAKDHVFSGDKGNAITLFKHPMNWDREFPTVEQLKGEMVQLSKDGSLPRGFFTKIQGLYEQAVFQQEKEKTEAWRWRIAYDFAKMKERKRNSKELNELLTDLQLAVLTGRGRFKIYEHSEGLKNFNLVRLAANWADFETRDKTV